MKQPKQSERITLWAAHDTTFDPRLKKRSVRSGTTERLFQLISANMALSLITEQISFILPMWLAMMHLEQFIRRRKERVMWWNQIWDIRLSSFTTTKQYFVLLGKLHCNFFLCLKSWPNAIKAPLINLFLKSWIYIYVYFIRRFVV